MQQDVLKQFVELGILAQFGILKHFWLKTMHKELA